MLSEQEWQQIDETVDRGLKWLATRQQPNGSFPTQPWGQPAVTSLCAMAFVSAGHMPGEGPYGELLDRSLNYIVSCQKPSGLLANVGPEGRTISRNVNHTSGSTAAYNHALSAILLSELYAMGSGDLERNGHVIEQAIQATLEMQRWPKREAADHGGWRYINVMADRMDSDLSVSGWHLMFLRSAKNAGFDVPKQPIDNAVAYVRRCFQSHFGTFTIMARRDDRRSRGMAGAGILALAHAGLHDSQEATLAGQWLLREGFPRYNEYRNYSGGWPDDRYHYGVFCASQAMYQLGDDYYSKFYPPVAKVILGGQRPNGSWQRESNHDGMYGEDYTTALMILTLGSSNQLLPIFQR